MYNHYRSGIEQDIKSRWKKYILLGAAILLGLSSVFAAGFFVGVKFEAKKQNLSATSQDIAPAAKDSKTEVIEVLPDAEKSKPETDHAITKEAKDSKVRDRDLTFYQSLTTNKKQATVGLETPKDSTPKKVHKKTPVPAGKLDSSSKIYTVQVGAYKETDVAEMVMDKLKKKGYRAYIIDKNIPQEGTIFKVRVGEFQTRDKAEYIAKKIKEKENMSAFVTLK